MIENRMDPIKDICGVKKDLADLKAEELSEELLN